MMPRGSFVDLPMSRDRETLPAERRQLVVGALSDERQLEVGVGGDGSQSLHQLALLHEP